GERINVDILTPYCPHVFSWWKRLQYFEEVYSH
ncbi:unnamed protein product, partial [Rhizoctonia solani]